MPGRAVPAAKRDRNPRGQGDQLRADLIDAAIELLGELGDFDALSVRAVTSRARVTHTALYLHFENKEQLLEAVKDRCFGELHRYLEIAERHAVTDPRAQAEAMCSAYLTFARERPGHYRVCFHTTRQPRPQGSGSSGPPASTRWPPSAAAAFADLLRSVGRCLGDDRDPTEVATMVWAGLHGFAELYSLGHLPLPAPDRYVHQLVESHLSPR